MQSDFPVQSLIEPLRRQLTERRFAVLQAPPGAGKTTVLPQSLLPLLSAGQSIVMLQPRRIAAVQAASRIASLLGEQVGQTVGYSIRFERRVSARTRIEIVTEGILTGRLQRDPELTGVGLVIFDEFHERSLQSDLGLAFALEAATLRDDLRILVMSATLDGTAVSRLLHNAPVLKADVRRFEVKIEYEDACRLYRSQGLRGVVDFIDRGQYLSQAFFKGLLSAVRYTLERTAKDILVFLPGQGEIRRAATMLGESLPDLPVVPLYGELSRKEQDEALRYDAHRRRLILATNVAQTSLTIEGVDAVIDSGFERRQRYDAGSGMSRLELMRIAKDAAEQRAGRAGRLADGYCLRMCSRSEFDALAERTPPEIAEADLAGFLLELRERGASPDEIALLDRPPAAALSRARTLLHELGALTEDRITAMGRQMSRLPLHPRLSRMLVASLEEPRGRQQSAAPHSLHEAADLAALLSERDPLRFRPDEPFTADLRRRLDWLTSQRGRNSNERLVRIADSLFRSVCESGRRTSEKGEIKAARPETPTSVAELLVLAFPDRIARRRAAQSSEYLLANGTGAILNEADPLRESEWLVVADLDTQAKARIRLALAADAAEIVREGSVSIRRVMRPAASGFQIVEEERLGAITLRSRVLSSDEADASMIVEAVLSRICEGEEWMNDAKALSLIQRVECLREAGCADLPACDTAALIADAERWLRPFIEPTGTITGYATPLRSRFTEEQRRLMERLAPESIAVPSGSVIRIDYASRPPVLAVKLQELFGLTETPRIGDGRIPLTLHLLSPAGRPVQITNDLRSFWTSTYADVRKELRGRYPKHPWPEDPLNAVPTKKTKRHTG